MMTPSDTTTDEIEPTNDWVHDAVMGGTLLGGGGGGSPQEGLETGLLALEYGDPVIQPLGAFDDDDLIVTVSAVGAPAATDRRVKPADYVRAFELVRDRLHADGDTVAGIMTNEMGGAATVNGMIQSAVTGVPLLDVACNGRAHPTGPMGSIGLGADHHTIQAGVGGDPATDDHLEVVFTGALSTAATTIRQAADDAGGLVAVARNPVSVAYAREHAATGVYDQAVELGRLLRTSEGRAAAEAVADHLEGSVQTVDTVEEVSLRTEGGFDVGAVSVGEYDLTFWNEWMTLDRGTDRLATFPDLIALLDATSGEPITTAAVEAGQLVAVVTAPADSIRLGAGMHDPDLFDPIETVLEVSIIDHVFPDAPGT